LKYDRRRLPNEYLAGLDPEEPSPELDRLSSIEPADDSQRQALQKEWNEEFMRWLGDTNMSPGYPAWSLLYYSVFTSIVPEVPDPVVVETGTNRGLSTILIAQALADLGVDAAVDTVDVDEAYTQTARRHVEAAGLTRHVRFHTGDSLEFLTELVGRVDHIDFAFLDGDHHAAHVMREIDIIVPKVAARRGKIYFDNSEPGGGTDGGVAEALEHLKATYGGNVVRFANCSWRPPGNAIWQPD
jgi:cephalosporin hydroxylase